MSNFSVTVIAVSFNSAAPLRSMLQTVPDRYPVVVVDNASEDDSVEVAERLGATVIVNEQNFGFSTACNIGADAAKTEYLFFLNPDTELEPDTIDKLYQATKRFPEASAFAPVLMSQSGVPWVKSSSILAYKERWLPCEFPDADFEVLAISGAAILVSRRNFEAVGKFDENIFLYFEDDDLSFRLRQQIGPLMIIRSARLMHLGGQSTSVRTLHPGFKHFQFSRSKTYVVRKHKIPYSVNRSIYECSLKFLVACLFFQRRRQIKYYYRVLGILSVEGKENHRFIDSLISRLAQVVKL